MKTKKKTIEVQLVPNAFEILEEYLKTDFVDTEHLGSDPIAVLWTDILETKCQHQIHQKIEEVYDDVLIACTTKRQKEKLKERRIETQELIQNKRKSLAKIVVDNWHFSRLFGKNSFNIDMSQKWVFAFKTEGEQLKVIDQLIVEPFSMIKWANDVKENWEKNTQEIKLFLDKGKNLNQVADILTPRAKRIGFARGGF